MSSLVLFGVRWQRQQQRKARGGRGLHQQQRRNSGPSYQKVSGHLSRGVVFIVPPGRPIITIASKNQNLQIVYFNVNALNNEIFPLAGGSSTSNVISKLERDTSSSSCSNIQDVATNDDEGEERPKSLSVGESSPEELRQQALEEKNKYKILKAERKSEEALKAFKRGKELERQAGALELLLRKNHKRALSTSNTTDIHKSSDENTCSGRKDNLAPQKSKEKDNLATVFSKLDTHDHAIGKMEPNY